MTKEQKIEILKAEVKRLRKYEPKSVARKRGRLGVGKDVRKSFIKK